MKSLFSRFCHWTGALFLLLAETLSLVLRGRIRWRLLSHQIYSIGVGSQLVVVVTGAFTGAVLAAQAYSKFNQLGLSTATGPVVALAMCRELGPVLAAIMVAGRMGAGIAAEIGTMKVTEQLDALRAMGVDATEYLVVPRFLALLISMPVLVAEAIAFGVLAADLLTVEIFGVPRVWFWEQVLVLVGPADVLVGVSKGLIFGVIIAMVSCHRGLKTANGAAGVGRSTTSAVVEASLVILIVNLFVTLAFNRLLPITFLNGL